jgi:hypothetical protein
MTEPASPALRTALAYYQAWTSHDLDRAMSYIAEGIVCDAPPGRHRHRRQDQLQPVHLRPGPVRRGQEGCGLGHNI